MKKAGAYIRRSSQQQTDNHSFKIQRIKIELTAKRFGYDVVEWFEDEATSAYHIEAPKRKGIKEMVRAIEEQSIEAVIYYDTDRLSRLIDDFVLAVYYPVKEVFPTFEFIEAGSDRPFDPEDPVIQTKLVFAYAEAQLKSGRGKSAQLKFLLQDTPLRPGSKAPFGMIMKDHVLYPDLEKAAIVRFIFELYCWGYSNQRIATILNEGSIPSPQKKNKWNASSIDVILHNPAYRGDLAWNRRESYHKSKRRKPEQLEFYFEGVYHPIIDIGTWALVEEVRNIKSTGETLKTPYALKHLLFCSTCHAELETPNTTAGNYKKKYKFYQCPKCNQKEDIHVVHKSVFENVSRTWAREASKWTKQTERMLTELKRITENKIEESLQVKETILIRQSQIDPDHPDSIWWKNACDSHLIRTNNRIQYQETLLGKINGLLLDKNYENILSKFQETFLDDLEENEKKVFCMMVIQRVEVELGKHRINSSIDYRLSPFVDLEEKARNA